MPHADPTYVIGVIREKEKGFLELDEYTRLISAPNTSDAVRALADTPYTKWIESKDTQESVIDSLISHLTDELAFLKDVVEEERVLQFIGARYDGLNIAAALIAYKRGDEKMPPVSPLGFISRDALYSAIWHQENGEIIPALWSTWLEEQAREVKSSDVRPTDILQRVSMQVTHVLSKTAVSPVAKAYARLMSDRLQLEDVLRFPDEDLDTRLEELGLGSEYTDEDVVRLLEDRGYRGFTPKIIEEVRSQTQASAWERVWDENVLRLLQEFRLSPIGYDPIISYWLAKEIEAKTLRLLVSAKMTGMSEDYMRSLIRPLYRDLT